MNQPSSFWKADNRPGNAPPLEIAALLGDWVNTSSETKYFNRVALRNQDGALLFRGYGSSDDNPIDWGDVIAQPYAGGTSTMAGGFVAQYEKNGIHTHLVSNQKLGILVIQSYTCYRDGSGRAPHFAREFFHR